MENGARWERVGALAAWVVLASIGSVLFSQSVGYDGFRLLATVQSLTPYLIVVTAAIAALALWRSWASMGVVAGSVGWGLLLLAVPIVFPPGQPAPLADATGLRVASINLLFENERTAEVADDLATRDLDIVVFSEYTAEHQEALLAHPLVERFEHREERDGLFAGGVAVWSRYPITVGTPAPTINYSIDLVVDGPDGPVRVLAVHPPTPIFDFSGWKRDLALIADVASTNPGGHPTLVIGDFNASYWHPVFRRLLRTGLTDAHIANGRGWSTSWPTDVVVPPFVRLDHALTDGGLVSTAVDDFRVPGSDHAGFVVTVVPAR